MKDDLTCAVVRDLLPSYIDKLTSRETGERVEAHLNGCAACRSVYGEMTGKEPPKAEAMEVDYLKKVSSSRRRLQRLALLAGCAVLALGAVAVLISKNYMEQATADAQTITAMKESEAGLQQQAADDAKTIADLKESEEELLKQLELPQVRYDPDTRVLVVTGTEGYDQLVLPPGHEKARTLDVQDDEFHLSVYIPLLKANRADLSTYLPAYIDRIDKSLDAIRTCLRERAPEVYSAELAGKMVEISIRDGNRNTFSNDEDRIFINLRDHYWNVNELYVLALLNSDSLGWAQLGYADYVAVSLNPYTEIAQIAEITPDSPYYELAVKAGAALKDMTGSDFRILFDVISRVCLDRGLTGWGSAYESMPLNICTGVAKDVPENSNLSVFMAASFLGWLDDAHGFEAVSGFAFGKKTFEEAFGTDFAAAFSAWKAYIVETYPLD